MKKTAKKLLSMALVLVMVLSMLPAVATPALAAENENPGTLESFGIAAKEWTAEERAEAEANPVYPVPVIFDRERFIRVAKKVML